MYFEKFLSVGRFLTGENTTAAEVSIGKQRILLKQRRHDLAYNGQITLRMVFAHTAGIFAIGDIQSWRRNWPRWISFFDYQPEIRTVIYTTNAIESANMSLRKLIKNRGLFPSDDALTKLFYLALRNISQKWMNANS